MNDKHDIEKILANCRVSPGARVRRSVLERFNSRFGTAGRVSRTAPFWMRPVPLYLAAAAVLAALLVAVPIQQRLLPHAGTGERHREAARPGDTDPVFDAQQIEWNVAESDLIGTG